MEGPTSATPFVTDLHGRVCDPQTGLPFEEGQAGPGSIFHVPQSSPDPSRRAPEYHMYTGENTSVSFSQVMQQAQAQGFQGKNIFILGTPRPQDLNRVPSPPPPEQDDSDPAFQYSYARFYRTKCNYCWAVVKGSERERGFTLQEIFQAAQKGCSTCNALHDGIIRFANLIFPKYNYEKVRIRQVTHGKSRLLSETKAANVTFDEFGAETMSLSFENSGKPEQIIRSVDHPK
jgi:hypothetical protein